MLKNLLILIAAILVIGLALCILNKKSMASADNSVPPILDGSVDPSLNLDSSYTINQLPAYCISMREEWISSKGIVSIFRWHFDDLKKMDDFFKPSSGLLIPEILSWPGPLKWSKDPDISEKTCWGPSYAVIFVKGKDIVRVCLNSRAMNDEQKKEYTKKIASSIAKKL